MSENFPDSEDRCADPIDHASGVETRARDIDVRIARSRAAPEQEPVRDAEGAILYWPITECVDCDDTIPEARLALARIRCVSCQEKKETKEKMYGKRA